MFGEARPTTAQGRPNGPLIGWGFSMDEGGSEIPLSRRGEFGEFVELRQNR